MDLNKSEQLDLLDSMPAYRKALIEQANALDINVTSSDEAANKANLLKLAQGDLAEVAPKVVTGLEQITVATEGSQEAADEALAAWQKMVVESSSAFINLQGGYDAVIQGNIDVATAAAEATESTTDSWETFYDGHTVNVDNYLDELQKQVDAQNNWESNMIELSGRVSKGVLDELTALGPEGAPLIASLADATDEQLQRVEDAYSERIGTNLPNILNNSQGVMEAAAAQYGQGTVDEITEKLRTGSSTIDQIISDYKLTVEGYVPVLQVNTSVAEGKIAAMRTAVAAAMTAIASFGSSSPAPAPAKNPRTGVVVPGNEDGDGYASGGFTGMGGKYEKAGTAHRREFVSTLETTAVPENRAALEYMHAGNNIANYRPAPTYIPAPSAPYGGGGGNTSTSRTLAPTYQISGEGLSPREVAEAIQFRSNQDSREP